MASETPDNDERDWVDEIDEQPITYNIEKNATYGDHINYNLTARQLTARQLRTLQPLVEGYIGLQGAEMTDYVYNVSCLAYT